VKRRLLGAALPVFIVSPAIAANLPVKAPPAPVPAPIAVPTWTGFYVGVNAGYAWGQNATNCTFVPGIAGPCEGIGFPDLKSRGGPIGAEIGANWQFQNWVVGAAVDWSALDLHADEFFPSVDWGKAIRLPVAMTGSVQRAAAWAMQSASRCSMAPAASPWAGSRIHTSMKLTPGRPVISRPPATAPAGPQAPVGNTG